MKTKTIYKASGKEQLINLGVLLAAITLAAIIGPRLANHSLKTRKEATQTS